MKFGDKEWFEKLNSKVDFPERYIYYYNKKENVIVVRLLESKAKIENARWQDVKPSIYAFQLHNDNAVLQVKEIANAQEYHDELVRLQIEWGTEKYQ